jgi:hypothetical protein
MRAECVHVLSALYAREDDLSQRRFSFFFKRRTLLAYAERAGRAGAGHTGAGAPDVPWEEWGPRNTRLMPQYAPFCWLR